MLRFFIVYSFCMSLVYAGIDEAGYGPMIGPLCVARATFRVDHWSPGDAAPDLWALLSEAVCAKKSDSKSRIAIGDSKKLKLANSSVRQHPLVHLERAVLAMLGTIGDVPKTDEELFDALGVRLEDHPWYGGHAIELPLGSTVDMLRIDCAHLKSVMNKRGVQLLSIRVSSTGEDRFNQIIRERRTKAAVTEASLLGHLCAIRDGVDADELVRVVCDRQSGRTRHSQMLTHVWDGLRTDEESSRASRYTLGETLGITFTPKADDAYLPVALASMAAKLVRELAMMRVNRYWSQRLPELKPTAGYVQDARRWLEDLRDEMSEHERLCMVRQA